MALILGIYENLIDSLKSLGTGNAFSFFRLDFKRFHRYIPWDFLLALVIGVGCSFILFSRAIHFALGHPQYRTFLYAFFMGMIIASIAFCYKKVAKWGPRLWSAIAIGAVLGFILTGYQGKPLLEDAFYSVEIAQSIDAPEAVENYDANRKLLLNATAKDLSIMWVRGDIQGETKVFRQSDQKEGKVSDFVVPDTSSWVDPWLIFCGAIGICAMLLPGISGSYVLMMLGAYSLAIGALVDLVNGWGNFLVDMIALSVLGNLLLGIVFGAVLFSRLISWCLKKEHDLTMSVLVGLMIGAIRVTWPFWSYTWVLDPLRLSKGLQLHAVDPFLPSLASAQLWIALLFTGFGFSLVYFLDKWANHFVMLDPEK